jgi:hypothetical protein
MYQAIWGLGLRPRVQAGELDEVGAWGWRFLNWSRFKTAHCLYQTAPKWQSAASAKKSRPLMYAYDRASWIFSLPCISPFLNDLRILNFSTVSYEPARVWVSETKSILKYLILCLKKGFFWALELLIFFAKTFFLSNIL